MSQTEQTVIGDAPNLAARLQALAEPGAVLICLRTHRLAGAHFYLPPRAAAGRAALNAFSSRFDSTPMRHPRVDYASRINPTCALNAQTW